MSHTGLQFLSTSPDMLYLLIGAVFLLSGLYLAYHAYRIKKNGVITTARITSAEKDFRGFNIYPVYEFFDENGNIIRATSGLSIFTFQKKLITIIYDPLDPQKVMPYNFFVMNGPFIVISIGFVFIIYYFTL